MTLLFDGTPQAQPGMWNGKLGFIYPPWDALENGGLAIPRAAQLQIVNDENGRFPGESYFRFEVAPGDRYQQQSGERVLLIRPETHQQGGVKPKPEELPNIDTAGSPPWGETRAVGMSFKLRADFGVPHSWLLFWQQKMSQYSYSPFWSLSIRSELDIDGGLPLGSTEHLKLYMDCDGGPFDGNGFTPAYKKRRATSPNAIEKVEQEQWYDTVAEATVAKDGTGQACLYTKKSSESQWAKTVYVDGDWVGQWPASTGAVNFTTFSQGLYRGNGSATHVCWQTGIRVTETFADQAARYAPSGRLHPRVTTDDRGSWLEIDHDAQSKGTYIYRGGVQVSRTFDPSKTRIKLEKAGAPPPDPGSVAVRPVDAIELGVEEVAV